MLSHFHHGRDGILFLLKLTVTLSTDFLFLHTVLLPRLPSIDSQHTLSATIASNQGTHFTTGMQQWTHRIHQSYHVPYPEAASWTEKWNSLLKTQLQHQLDSSILQSWATFSRKLSVKSLNQYPIYDAVSLMTRFMGPRIKGWKWEWHLSTVALVIPQQKVFLLFPRRYAQLTQWCQFQREECFHEETQQ